MISMCPVEEQRDKLFNKCLIMAGVDTVIAAILAGTIWKLF